MTGSESSCHLQRALCSAELYLYTEFYTSHPHFISILKNEKNSACPESIFLQSITFEASDIFNKSLSNYHDCLKLEALKNCTNRRWSPFICLMAMASVLGLQVRSLYPDTGKDHMENFCNALLLPRESQNKHCSTINLLWSFCVLPKMQSSFRPNHIVPIFIVKNENVELKVPYSKNSHQSKISFPKVKAICASASSFKSDSISGAAHNKLSFEDHDTTKPEEVNFANNFDYDVGSFFQMLTS